MKAMFFKPVFLFLAAAACYRSSATAQTVSAPPKIVAGIPVNYEETLVGSYTLPDPLLLNGKPVRDAKTWYSTRRPEIFRLFEENQFGAVRRRLPV
jgi:hypothetical protein